MEKTLDKKLAEIQADPSGSKAFIIADAKDADMAFGIAAPGPATDGKRMKSVVEYREQIREIVEQGLVDVMLLSTSNLEILGMRERLFDKSPITPAARANDTTDIWAVRGGKYVSHASRSFRSASLEHIMYGEINGVADRKVVGADLGLYSITFTNDLNWDYKALEDYQKFRVEAEKLGFRHFLEVFNPNVDPGIRSEDVYGFLNDHIVRALAGVASKGRPLFLKIAYNGPRALEELAAYDPNLVIGILGGAAGTTLDAFQLIHDAQKHGARVALFGRKINLSEHPLSFVKFLRAIVEDEVKPVEAVKAYHGELSRLNLSPVRTLEEDLLLTNPVMRYR